MMELRLSGMTNRMSTHVGHVYMTRPQWLKVNDSDDGAVAVVAIMIIMMTS